MRLFSFFNPIYRIANQINQLDGISIKHSDTIIFEMSDEVSQVTIERLLNILKQNKISFSFFDKLYPHGIKPGATFFFSQEKNDLDSHWSMTYKFQDSTWTGGIYSISQKNIILQIVDLLKMGKLDSISIGKVKVPLDENRVYSEFDHNQNAKIYGLHGKIVEIIADFIVFGIFTSDNYSPYMIYKLTKDKLYVDKRGIWHSQRHTKKGYVFEGAELSREAFEVAKELMENIPLALMQPEWEGFYTTGNKNEDKLIIEFANNDFHRTISIDSYEIEVSDLPETIREYWIKVENTLLRLTEINSSRQHMV